MAEYLLDHQQLADLLALRAMCDWWFLRSLVVHSERARRRAA